MTTSVPGSGGTSLRHAVLHHAPAILAAAAIAFVGVWLFSSSRTPSYRATATISYNQLAGARVELAEEDIEPDRALALRAQHVTQPDVLEAANGRLEELGLRVGSIEVEGDLFLGSVSITATSDDAADAAAIATAVAEATAAWEAQDAEQAVEEAVANLEALVDSANDNVAALAAQVADNPDDVIGRARLDDAVGRLLDAQQRIDDLRLRQATTGSGVDRVEAAAVPGSPVSPVPLRDAAVAALMAAIGTAGVLWYRRLVSSEWTQQAEDTMRAPVLAMLPPAGPDLVRDAQRTQRLDALFRVVHHTMRTSSTSVLTVTGLTATVAPTLAAELAQAGARLGRRILLVDTEPRGVRVRGFGHDAGPVVSNGHHQERRDLGPGGRHEPRLPCRQIRDGLDAVLLRDIQRDRPGASLSDVLRSAAAEYDVVVVDAPPMTDVTVSMALESAGAVLVVVTPAASTPELDACRRTLDLLGATVVGFVVSKRGRGGAEASSAASTADAIRG